VANREFSTVYVRVASKTSSRLHHFAHHDVAGTKFVGIFLNARRRVL
jgi:hypothetical protein